MSRKVERSPDNGDDAVYEAERKKAAALALRTKTAKTAAGFLLIGLGMMIALVALKRGSIGPMDLGSSLAFVGIGFWLVDREGASGLFDKATAFLPWKK